MIQSIWHLYYQVCSMNDKVVHTGFLPMGHYLFAIGVGKK